MHTHFIHTHFIHTHFIHYSINTLKTESISLRTSLTAQKIHKSSPAESESRTSSAWPPLLPVIFPLFSHFSSSRTTSSAFCPSISRPRTLARNPPPEPSLPPCSPPSPPPATAEFHTNTAGLPAYFAAADSPTPKTSRCAANLRLEPPESPTIHVVHGSVKIQRSTIQPTQLEPTLFVRIAATFELNRA